jgi:uncharacterized lipoprotein YddW (UPF0748 family)
MPVRRLVVVLVLCAIAGFVSAVHAAPVGDTQMSAPVPPELRGIWVHGTQVKTATEADAVIARIDRANLNAVFLLVWYWGGQAFFRSDLCPMGDGVAPGYDPLGYMVTQCHKRGIQVHAWFVNGAYGSTDRKYVLDKHPDWAVDDGAGGPLWYDLGNPAVRRFESDLMIECLSKYDVDGIHFDYIRYGPRQCYCNHCQQEFAQRYGEVYLTPEESRKYPAGISLTANPLVKPTTATVLAVLSDGTPAIALNRLGAGMVLLLNWHAENDMPPAVAQTVKVMLDMWTMGGPAVYMTTTEATRKEYGTDSYEAARVVLTRLKYPPKPIPAERIDSLSGGNVLVLPAVYLIGRQTADDLEHFVQRGGRLLVIDGPAKSMSLAPIQRITGFARTGAYICRDDVIQPTGRSPLTPKGQHRIDPTTWKYRMQRWAEYRKGGVTELVRDVYSRAKKIKPQAQVSAAVCSSIEAADAAYQDWPRWLRDKTIDYVVPMAYTEDMGELARQIGQWKTVDDRLQRIVPGLAIYHEAGGKTTTRKEELIRDQQRLCRRQGARGNVYFSFQYLNDPVLMLLRTEFYPNKAPVYTPTQLAGSIPAKRVP